MERVSCSHIDNACRLGHWLLTTLRLATAGTRAAVESLPLSVVDLTSLDLDVRLGGYGTGSLGNTTSVAVAGESAGKSGQQRHQAKLEELHDEQEYIHSQKKRMNVVVGLKLKGESDRQKKLDANRLDNPRTYMQTFSRQRFLVHTDFAKAGKLTLSPS